MTSASRILLALLLAAAPSTGSTQNRPDPALSWVGKRVIVLPDTQAKPRCRFDMGGIAKASRADLRLPQLEATVASFTGKGAVTLTINSLGSIRVTVPDYSYNKDDPNTYCLGFVDQRNAADSLRGTVFWTRGYGFPESVRAYTDTGAFLEPTRSRSVLGFSPELELRPATRVRLVGTQWVRGGGFSFVLETEDGRWFAIAPVYFGGTPMTQLDFLHQLTRRGLSPENPATIYPNWSQVVWQQIREGRPVVGMTKAMVEYICGSLVDRGFVGEASAAGATILHSFNCVIDAGRYVFPVFMQADTVARIKP